MSNSGGTFGRLYAVLELNSSSQTCTARSCLRSPRHRLYCGSNITKHSEKSARAHERRSMQKREKQRSQCAETATWTDRAYSCFPRTSNTGNQNIQPQLFITSWYIRSRTSDTLAQIVFSTSTTHTASQLRVQLLRYTPR